MFSIPLYYRLLQLNASNGNLLEMYHNLYHELDGEEKTELITRINFRKRFELELHNCLDKKFVQHQDAILKRASIFCVAWLNRLEFTLLNLFSGVNRKLCYDLELDNKQIYYKILYSQMLSPFVTDLLLKQKNEVEGYLLKEI